MRTTKHCRSNFGRRRCRSLRRRNIEPRRGILGYLFGTRIAGEFQDVTQRVASSLADIHRRLEGSSYGKFLLDHFSVADAYLVTVINWTMATPPVELAKWPAVKAYYERLRARPSVAMAVAEEFELYKAELARQKAAA